MPCQDEEGSLNFPSAGGRNWGTCCEWRAVLLPGVGRAEAGSAVLGRRTLSPRDAPTLSDITPQSPAGCSGIPIAVPVLLHTVPWPHQLSLIS